MSIANQLIRKDGTALAEVIHREKLFSELRTEADCERVVSILKRQQDEQATTATLYEIRRLKREAAQRRAGIDGLLVKISGAHVAAHLTRQSPDDLGLPADSEASS